MTQKLLALTMAFLLSAELTTAAEPMILKTNWTGFRDQAAQQKLNGRKVSVTLTSNRRVETRLLQVSEAGMVVREGASTREWRTAQREAMIPRDQIASIRFHGKVGRSPWIGALAGLGAGAGAVAISAAAMEGCEGPTCGSVLLLIPVGAVGGWLIGRALAGPAPEFVIEP